MPFDQFDQVRIISLAHRKDRRHEVTAELKRLGLDIDGDRVAFFDAFKSDDANGFYSAGAHGCYLSHMTLLEQATGSILILEDDCDFTESAKSYIVPECDIFYGGYYAQTPGNPEDSDIIGAHMMGYFTPNVVAQYLRRILKDEEFRSNVPPPPIDGAIVWYRRANPDVRTVFAVPALAHQRPSRTDIGQSGWIDRIKFIGSSARKIKRIFSA
jgi:glycosyl transferase, family 25